MLRLDSFLTADANAEFGEFRDRNGGTSGTILEASMSNDMLYQLYRVLIEANVVPNRANGRFGDGQLLLAINEILNPSGRISKFQISSEFPWLSSAPTQDLQEDGYVRRFSNSENRFLCDKTGFYIMHRKYSYDIVLGYGGPVPPPAVFTPVTLFDPWQVQYRNIMYGIPNDPLDDYYSDFSSNIVRDGYTAGDIVTQSDAYLVYLKQSPNSFLVTNDLLLYSEEYETETFFSQFIVPHNLVIETEFRYISSTEGLPDLERQRP